MHSEAESSSPSGLKGTAQKSTTGVADGFSTWSALKWTATTLAGVTAGYIFNPTKYIVTDGISAYQLFDQSINAITQGIKHTGLDGLKEFIKYSPVPAEYSVVLMAAGAMATVGAYAYMNQGETGRQFHRHLFKAAAVATVSTLALATLGPLVGLPAVFAFKAAAGIATSAAVHYGVNFIENTATRAYNWYYKTPERPEVAQAAPKAQAAAPGG